MRKYLMNFFNEFDYDKKDAEQLLSAYDTIVETAEASVIWNECLSSYEKNEKMNKVSHIAEEIGRQPVLSFGNSSGDQSMHMYTITGNPYKSAAFMLIADDDERDYGNPEKG